MESTVWVPLLSGFAGALIGAGASIVTVIIQGSREDRRETARLAAELAKIDHLSAIDLLKSMGRSGSVTPLPLYIAYYTDLMAALDKGELTAERLQVLRAKSKRLVAVIDQEPP